MTAGTRGHQLLSGITTAAGAVLLGIAVIAGMEGAGALLDHRVIFFPAMLGLAYILAGSGLRAHAAWAPPAVCVLSALLLFVIARNEVPFHGLAAAAGLLLAITSLAPAYRAWPALKSSPLGHRKHLMLCASFAVLAIATAPVTQCHSDFGGGLHCHSFWVSVHVH
jgi:hypothetical protein